MERLVRLNLRISPWDASLGISSTGVPRLRGPDGVQLKRESV